MVAKKRYVRRSSVSTQSKGETKPERRLHEKINTYLMTFSTVGLLAAAIGQIVVSIRQMQLTEATTRLQLAEAKPRLQVRPSHQQKAFGNHDYGGDIILPESFLISIIRGIENIITIDAPVTLYVSDSSGDNGCDIEVRGLYIQDDDRNRLRLFSPPQEDFQKMVEALGAAGIEIIAPTWGFAVTYEDIYGQKTKDSYNSAMRRSDGSGDALVLYSGAWSNGAGFYFDEFSTPEQHCPAMAKKIRKVLLELGGHPGNI